MKTWKAIKFDVVSARILSISEKLCHVLPIHSLFPCVESALKMEVPMKLFKLVLEVTDGFYKNQYKTKVIFLAVNEDEATKQAGEWWERHQDFPQNNLFSFGGFTGTELSFTGVEEMLPYDGGFLA
jgi:hypothetical protein